MRNADGRVCGEHHHRAKWPDAVVELARSIAESMGFGARRTCWELRRRGYDVSLYAVEHWVKWQSRLLIRPSYAESVRTAGLRHTTPTTE